MSSFLDHDPLEVEFSESDDESKMGIEDDVKHAPSRRISSRWLENNMKELENQFNSELFRNANTEEHIAEHGGTLNYMDGRHHAKSRHKKEKDELRQHKERTRERHLCKLFFQKRGCKWGAWCTKRHTRWEEYAEEDKQKVRRLQHPKDEEADGPASSNAASSRFRDHGDGREDVD